MAVRRPPWPRGYTGFDISIYDRPAPAREYTMCFKHASTAQETIYAGITTYARR